MNPFFQALTGGFGAGRAPAGQTPMQPMGGPFGGIQGVMQRVQQLAGSFRDPQQMIQQYFPDAPEAARSDPDQMVAWLQQSGKVNPQIIQMARQMMGR